jgi:nitrate reductase molybdenum cofactor assembly chaperone
MDREAYDVLARLLTYPEDLDIRPEFGACLPARAAGELAVFAEKTAPLSLHDRQELFIQTFDLNPVCALEIGWHLFGENYDRGLLLVKMRQQLRMYGLAETTELPDHLTNGLRLLARMERESGAYFAEAVVLPALEKMLEAIRGKNNPYEHVLEAARLVVREDFPELPAQLATPKVETELRVLA